MYGTRHVYFLKNSREVNAWGISSIARIQEGTAKIQEGSHFLNNEPPKSLKSSCAKIDQGLDHSEPPIYYCVTPMSLVDQVVHNPRGGR